MLQKSQEMVDLGISGPEAHEMCRPEEVCSNIVKDDIIKIIIHILI